MPKEKLNDLIDRRIITGEKVMLTHVYLKKGAVVPMHSHDNEQITYILEGKLKFWIESEDADPITIGPGDVITLPSNLSHKAEALEDTLDVDIFAPPREDWLKKEDDYLRG
jgi:quercetin dioxygenase-like cupin family protein